jgi:DNA polymerase III epsilon subunit family exonuclease
MIRLKKPCPRCSNLSVVVHRNGLSCESCDFKVSYCCPICDANLSHASFSEGSDPQYTCETCRNTVSLAKIAYIIDNGMHVDYSSRCPYCNGPTLHRQSMNMGNRCFFFPRCSGPVDLFGGKTERSFVFLDFETTGLDAGRDAIIEIGALKLDGEGLEHVYQSFVKPPVAISAKITHITGITDEMVAHAPTIAESIHKLVAFLGDATLVIHNADFDMMWLGTALLQHSIVFPDRPVICTLKWARQNQETQCSLGALSKKYKIGHQNAHRALADAAATKELFFIFDQLKKDQRPELAVSDYMGKCQQIMARYGLVPIP